MPMWQQLNRKEIKLGRLASKTRRHCLSKQVVNSSDLSWGKNLAGLIFVSLLSNWPPMQSSSNAVQGNKSLTRSKYLIQQPLTFSLRSRDAMPLAIILQLKKNFITIEIKFYEIIITCWRSRDRLAKNWHQQPFNIKNQNNDSFISLKRWINFQKNTSENCPGNMRSSWGKVMVRSLPSSKRICFKLGHIAMTDTIIFLLRTLTNVGSLILHNSRISTEIQK